MVESPLGIKELEAVAEPFQARLTIVRDTPRDCATSSYAKSSLPSQSLTSWAQVAGGRPPIKDGSTLWRGGSVR